jgi:hypothetical protein
MSLGAYVCKKMFYGSSVFGIKENKDMRDFCFFKEDNSLIEINSLSDYAKQFLK